MSGKQVTLGCDVHPLLARYRDAEVEASAAETGFAEAWKRLEEAVMERGTAPLDGSGGGWYRNWQAAEAAEKAVDAFDRLRRAQSAASDAFEAWHDAGAYETTWEGVET